MYYVFFQVRNSCLLQVLVETYVNIVHFVLMDVLLFWNIINFNFNNFIYYILNLYNFYILKLKKIYILINYIILKYAYLLTKASKPFLRSSIKSSSKIPSSPRNGIWRFQAFPGNGGTTIYKFVANIFYLFIILIFLIKKF